MKFIFSQDANAKNWLNPRYGVHVSRQGGEEGLVYVVYVSCSDKKDGVYNVVMPRFEVQGKTVKESQYKAGAIAEALLRHLRRDFQEDAPLSKIKKLLDAIVKLLRDSGQSGVPGRTKSQILMPPGSHYKPPSAPPTN